MKHLLENSQDIHLALLTYSVTPMLWCGLSPAELLMGRRICADVPQVKCLFVPRWPHLKNFRMLDQKDKAEQSIVMTVVIESNLCHHIQMTYQCGWTPEEARYLVKSFNLLILLYHIWSMCHLDKFMEIIKTFESELKNRLVPSQKLDQELLLHVLAQE